MTFFTGEARKAQVAFVLAFLTPISTYISATGEWSWRAFAGTVVSGLITGLGVFYTDNRPPKPTRSRYQRSRQEELQ